MLRAFFRDCIIYTIPAAVSRGLGLLLVPIYTRILSPEDYGTLDMLMVFGGLVNLTVALEVSQGVARFYAVETSSARKRSLASTAFWFTLGCYGLFVLLGLAGSRVLSPWVTGRDGLESIFRIAVFGIGLNGVFYLIQNQFRWELRSRRYTETNLLMSFVTLVAAVGFAYGLDWGLVGVLWGTVLGSLAGVVYGLSWLRTSYGWQFDCALLWRMLRFSIPLVPSGLMVWMSTYLDRLMINHYLSLHEVGLYGVGYRLSSVVWFVLVGVQGALMPLVYHHYREPSTPSQLATIFRLFLAGALLTFLTLTLFAHDFLVIMTTPDFYGSASVVIYLVPAITLSQMYIFAPGIGIAKKTHVYIWINLAGVVVNALLNWWLIPALGMIGAAIATLAGSSCVFALCMYISQKSYPVPHEWKRLSFATVLAIALAVLIPTLAEEYALPWIVNLLALGVMAVGLVALGLVRTHEIVRLRQLLRPKLTP
ncbi:oligosaccharide flippase family protein [Tepidimonas taiwanensis]|uniref:Polysaccharide biosynthesis protein n=1 Tax=Tepidimonas taiwanensis TaxID=307486 RepID=A0A554X6F1_9BURK|nr:oligosaccharide flippase family protein [Tepidimonas taiwanensis]TSE31336.1 Polysaccharide biosynthesis protein [Tepidimonas taiwanensis]UBQ06147.1 oligosaccharide flippase family protein [Tepidimonas taiwanensis]